MKVWVYKGDMTEKEFAAQQASAAPRQGRGGPRGGGARGPRRGGERPAERAPQSEAPAAAEAPAASAEKPATETGTEA